MAKKQSKQIATIIPPTAQAGGGEKPKSAQAQKKLLRDMAMSALEMNGGEAYLAYQAIVNPGPFMALLGKLLPLQVKHDGEVGVEIRYVTRRSVPAKKR